MVVLLDLLYVAEIALMRDLYVSPKRGLYGRALHANYRDGNGLAILRI